MAAIARRGAVTRSRRRVSSIFMAYAPSVFPFAVRGVVA
jgi:hypothetical protein